MTRKTLGAAAALSSAAIAMAAAPTTAGAIGANMYKGFDSRDQVGKKSYPACGMTYRFGRYSEGFLWVRASVSNSACRVSFGLFANGTFNVPFGSGWVSGSMPTNWNAGSQTAATSFYYRAPWPYNHGNNVYIKLTTSIPAFGPTAQVGEAHDIYNR